MKYEFDVIIVGGGMQDAKQQPQPRDVEQSHYLLHTKLLLLVRCRVILLLED
jgi:hypothetical protein